MNNQYLSICKTNKVDIPRDLKIGDSLNLKASYFHKAYRCVFELGIKLSQVVWRKFINEDLENADFNFISVIYDQIVRKDYELAIGLSEFSTHKVIRHFNEETKLTCVVNKAQTYKW